MIANQAAFADRLVTHKPDWPKLAEVFTKAGLLDARGKPPTAEATRKTWYRVTRATRPAPVKSTPRPVIQPARPISPPTTPCQPGHAPGGSGLDEVLKAMEAGKGQMPKPFK